MESNYVFGFSTYQYLSVKGKLYSHSDIILNDLIRVIECNIDEKWMTVKVRNTTEENVIEVDLSELKKGVVVDLDERGTRWEGDYLNGCPFGYGCIFNENNELVYTGFIFEGMKVCYGSDFYGDIGIVEYVGGYYNNKRFGYGKLYDKKNKLIADGEWINNQPINNRSLHIENTLNEDLIHFGLKEITIGNKVNCKYPLFQLRNYFHLMRITIGNNSCSDVQSFIIENCNELASIDIGSNSFCNDYNMNSLFKDKQKQLSIFSIKNCANLRTTVIDTKSFMLYNQFELESIK